MNIHGSFTHDDENSNLSQQLRNQIEFYFSTMNLAKDTFLQRIMHENHGFVPIWTVANFPRVKYIYWSAIYRNHSLRVDDLPPVDPGALVFALRDSQVVHVQGYNLAPAQIHRPVVSPYSLTHQFMIVVESIPRGTTVQDIEDAFSTHTTCPSNIEKMADSTNWVVYFDSEVEAREALYASKKRLLGDHPIAAQLQSRPHQNQPNYSNFQGPSTPLGFSPYTNPPMGFVALPYLTEEGPPKVLNIPHDFEQNSGMTMETTEESSTPNMIGSEIVEYHSQGFDGVEGVIEGSRDNDAKPSSSLKKDSPCSAFDDNHLPPKKQQRRVEDTIRSLATSIDSPVCVPIIPLETIEEGPGSLLSEADSNSSNVKPKKLFNHVKKSKKSKKKAASSNGRESPSTGDAVESTDAVEGTDTAGEGVKMRPKKKGYWKSRRDKNKGMKDEMGSIATAMEKINI